MAAVHLCVEQVNYQAEDILFDKISALSFNNVINANLDLHLNEDMDDTSVSEHVVTKEFNTALLNHSAQSTSIEQVPNFENDAIPKHSALSEGDLLYSYDSLDTIYPNISLPVAQYLTQHNPQIFRKAANLLSKQEINFETAVGTDFPSSPLRSLSSTSEALALQQSVIGNSSVTPVSPEVVAEIVASTHLRYTQGASKPCLSKNASSLECNDKSIKIDEKVIYSELVKYPPESISASVEKKSWFSNVPVKGTTSEPSSPMRSVNKHQDTKSRSRRNSQSSLSNIVSKQGKKLYCQEVAATHFSRKSISEDVINNLDKERRSSKTYSLFKETSHSNHSCISEPDNASFISEKYDTESIFSEVYETDSNMSETSGIDEEMFQIKKLLIDVPNIQANALDLENTGSKVAFFNTETQTMNEKHNCATETESNSEIFEVLRERACLEGQLEMLKSEMDLIITERSNLQKSLSVTETKLETQTKETDLVIKEKEAALKELERLRAEGTQWDHVISEYQNVIEAKNLEIKALKEDLSDTERVNEKLKITLEEFNVDLEAKEGAVVGLKNKIAELHVEVQVLLQNKVQLENDVKSIRAETDTLQKSKDWYQEQLHSAQESRNKLHQELITTQANSISLSNLVEQLKVENSHTKQHIVDVQQRAVKEKEVLMKHLENIEADMMERESLFNQIQQDHGSAENALNKRAKMIEEERIRLTSIMYKVSDLEHNVEILKQDLSEREKLIMELEKDRTELTKRVTLLQKSINDKELTLQHWEQSSKSLEQKLRHAELELSSKEEYIFVLKSEKTAVEVALAAASEEKKNVDESLKIVKDNLNRVENSFKQMRTELITKSSHVEQLLKEKHKLEDAYQKLEEHSLQQEKKHDARTLADNLNQEVMVDDLRKQKKDLEHIISSQQQEIQQIRRTCLNTERYNEDLLQQINSLKMSLEEARYLNETLNKNSNSLLTKLKSKHDFSIPLEITRQKSNKKHIPNIAMNNKVCCIDENELPIDVEDILKIIHQECKEKQRVYESNIKILTRKLKEKIKESKRLKDGIEPSKKSMEACVQTDNNNFTTDKQGDKDVTLEVYKLKIKELEEQFDSMKNTESSLSDHKSKHKNNKTVEEYEFKIKEIEDELSSVKKVVSDQKLQIERKQVIILELEKEKGQLTGISNNQITLKRQVSELENCLANKESIISSLEHQMQTLKHHHVENEEKLNARIEAVEKDLLREKTLVKELRHVIFQEKRESSRLKRQLTSLKSALKLANQTADSRQKDIANLSEEINIRHGMERKHKSEMEQLHTQCKQKNSHVEQLQKELQETKDRDPALAEQIKSLGWHLKEKNQEAAVAKEQLKITENRNAVEMKTLTEKLQAYQMEIENIKLELGNCRKEKFSYQAKATELRNALKSSLLQSKQLQKQIANQHEQDGCLLRLPLPDSPAPYDDKFIASLLQQSSVLPESRPLSNLQVCLNSLKQEMAVLQKQLEDNEHLNKFQLEQC